MMIRVKLVIISRIDGSTVSRLISSRICSESDKRLAVAGDGVQRPVERAGLARRRGRVGPARRRSRSRRGRGRRGGGRLLDRDRAMRRAMARADRLSAIRSAAFDEEIRHRARSTASVSETRVTPVRETARSRRLPPKSTTASLPVAPSGIASTSFTIRVALGEGHARLHPAPEPQRAEGHRADDAGGG